VEHDDMNVLVLGGLVVGRALAHDLVQAFLGARFGGAPRHLRRLEKVRALELRYGGAHPGGAAEEPCGSG
jgi:ribose 5-phosphate isomerase B